MNYQHQPEDTDIVAKLRELHRTTLILIELMFQFSLVSINTQYQSHVCSRCGATETPSSTVPDVRSSSVLPDADRPTTSTTTGQNDQRFPGMATPSKVKGKERQRDPSIPKAIPVSLPGDLVDEFMNLPDHMQGLIRLQHAVMDQTRAMSHRPNTNFQRMPPVREHAENIQQPEFGTSQNEGSRGFSFKNFFFKRRTAR